MNFAYSLVLGLITGNANVVRMPTKEFQQISVIIKAIENTLSSHESIRPYITLIRYKRSKEINDYLSSISDARIVWGGDSTIENLRLSPIPPRCREITFADRFSLSLIDADAYLEAENKEHFARDFYNDTYYSDQNACTSPKLVVWTGKNIEDAKEIFWENLHEVVKNKYEWQPIIGIEKMTRAYEMAAYGENTRIISMGDNLITRIELKDLTSRIFDIRSSAGFFFEYDCKDIMELRELASDKRVQTIGILGDKNMIRSEGD